MKGSREKEGLLPSSPGAGSVSFWGYCVHIRSLLSISGVFCNLSWAHVPSLQDMRTQTPHTHGLHRRCPSVAALGGTNCTTGLCPNLSVGVLYSRRPSLSPPSQAKHPPGVCSPQQHVLAVCAHGCVCTGMCTKQLWKFTYQALTSSSQLRPQCADEEIKARRSKEPCPQPPR